MRFRVPRRADVVAHLPVADLQRRYRQTAGPVERMHRQIVLRYNPAGPSGPPQPGTFPPWIRRCARP